MVELLEIILTTSFLMLMILIKVSIKIAVLKISIVVDVFILVFIISEYFIYLIELFNRGIIFNNTSLDSITFGCFIVER